MLIKHCANALGAVFWLKTTFHLKAHGYLADVNERRQEKEVKRVGRSKEIVESVTLKMRYTI